MHPLLNRQVKRHICDPTSVPPELQNFLKAVDDAYVQFDADHGMLERSLALSSEELLQTNTKLQDLLSVVEAQVADRTAQLLQANIQLQGFLNLLEDQVATRTAELADKNIELNQTLNDLQKTQIHLIQSEKISSLGQLVGGVAHEINNPVNFIHANLAHLRNDIGDLLSFIQLFHQVYPDPLPILKKKAETIDLDYLYQDLPKLLSSMETGTCRIKDVVLSLRNFSRLDESEYKTVDVHEGINSTLLLLGSRLAATLYRPEIEVTRQYGSLPYVECYPGQLNQVFMNLLVNAIDALDERDQKRAIDKNSNDRSQIWIITEVTMPQQVCIRVIDNAQGIEESVRLRIFDPFFTTKAIGKGTGMGLSISYQIITEQHQGTIECLPNLGQGTEFVITLPIELSLPSLGTR